MHYVLLASFTPTACTVTDENSPPVVRQIKLSLCAQRFGTFGEIPYLCGDYLSRFPLGASPPGSRCPARNTPLAAWGTIL